MIVGSLLLILVAVGLLVAGVLSGSNALIVCSIVVVALAAIVLVLGVRQSAAAADKYDDDSDDDGDGNLTSEYPAVPDNGFRVRQTDRRRESGGDEVPRDPYAAIDETDEVAVTGRRAARNSAMANGAGSGAPVLSATTADHGQMAVDEQTGRGIPSQGTDREGYAFDAPAYDAPAYEAPAYEAPAYDTPSYETPSYDTPSYETQLIGVIDDADLDVDADEDPPDEPSAQMVTPASAARVAMLSTEVLVVDGRPRYHVPGCVHLLSRETEPLPVGEAVELGFSPCGLCEPDSALLADARRV